MMDALEAYQNTGGCLMYLGGNGFYWVTGVFIVPAHCRSTTRLCGIRSWESHPGEMHMACTGEKGALWRHRGGAEYRRRNRFRVPGVGPRHSAFKQLPARDDPRASWIFEGIGRNDPRRFSGPVMSGASGDELDAANFKLGTPPHALVLATSGGMQSHDREWSRRSHSPSRTSMALTTRYPRHHHYETAQGGAVSLPLDQFFRKLSWNNYDNNISRDYQERPATLRPKSDSG